MGVLDERFQVTDTEMAGACFENISKCQSAQSCIAAGAASPYRQALRIHPALPDQVQCPVDTVVDIPHAPHAVQALAICPSIARTAAIVHVQDANAAAGPIL